MSQLTKARPTTTPMTMPAIAPPESPLLPVDGLDATAVAVLAAAEEESAMASSPHVPLTSKLADAVSFSSMPQAPEMGDRRSSRAGETHAQCSTSLGRSRRTSTSG